MNRLRALTLASVIGLSICASACVTSGPHFTMAEVRSLQPGVTTRSEAIALLGGPTSVSAMANGTLVQWMYIGATPFASEGRHVSILFGPDDRMIRISHEFQR